MSSQFEIVVDERGKFHFQLRGPDGVILLRSVSRRERGTTEIEIAQTRAVLNDVTRMIPYLAYDGSHFLVLKDQHDRVLAQSPRVPSRAALVTVGKRIKSTSANAPLVDLTQRAEAG